VYEYEEREYRRLKKAYVDDLFACFHILDDRISLNVANHTSYIMCVYYICREDVYAIDHKTGQPLFKPKLPPPPQQAGVTLETSPITATESARKQPRDMYTELLVKEKMRQRKIELAREKAEVSM
jgi:hypothetical protein